MIFPKKLKKGDTVAIIATSSPIQRGKVDACEKLVQSMGYRVKMGQCTYKSIRGYSAGTGEERAKEINEMFADKEVDGIWCIRGGDTSSHAMDKINLEIVKSNPKMFVGYSDVTNFHVLFNQRADLVTFHGPMVASNMLNDWDDYTRESFEKIINMDRSAQLTNPPGNDFKVLNHGKAQGLMIGGNLALLTSMIGTPYEVDTKDKILFFEDVNENITRVDRMLYQLKYSGKLSDAAGIVVGDFAKCKLSDPAYGLPELLKDVMGDLDKPVFYNIVAGHCSPTATLPFGVRCDLNTEDNTIKFYK